MCRCASLDAAVEALPTRDAFTTTLDLLEASTTQWAELMRCRDCGQYWKVETGAYRGAEHAFKLSSANDWLVFDERPARAALLTRIHGGTSSQKCMQAGCSARALVNLAFCVQHLETGYKL